MGKHKNVFSSLNEAELKTVYQEYIDWCGTGVIAKDTSLNTLKQTYIEQFSTSALHRMELDFLQEVAKRYFGKKES